MKNKQIPFYLEGIYESIYAGFWIRLGSTLLDFLIVMPIVILTMYLNSLSMEAYFYTIIPTYAFAFWFHVYLVKKYGGTPGKIITGITIIRLDGEEVGWKEAILRHIVMLGITVCVSVVTIISLVDADPVYYDSLGWLEKHEYLTTFFPTFFTVYTWLSNIWIYSEFFVLLTNKRKRAIHDYIAGTVIVKKEYLAKLRESVMVEA